MSGELIGHRYRVLRKIGEGGMAVVSIAVDEKLGRDVAIKILKERYENHDEIRVRFQHEARAISAFDHPNILKIFDFSGEESKQLWIVTELIHGRNLGQILETTPSGWLHPVIAASIVRELCRALNTAHEHGVVHRDVKPENVMITHQGAVKLMDFGIAKIQRISSMTQTGMFMGSPSYMSPEQVRGRDIDHRSDIYSLGVLFYELVTGKLPYSGSSTADIAMKILGGEYVHPKFIMDGVPAEIDRCIVQCMDLLPENRPQSIEDVGRTLDHLLQSLGLESSMQELERCFRDPKAYGDRLARVLRVTDARAASTVVEKTPLPWNSEAIRSPIPRPDISGENLPQGSSRRDHLLPPKRIPHFTKRPLSPDQIAAHLPERRHQQRELDATRHLETNRHADVSIATPTAHIHPVEPTKQKPHVTPQRQRSPSHRDMRHVSRAVPIAPKKVHRVRYVVHQRPRRSEISHSFGKLIAAILLLTAAGILWLGIQKNTLQQPRQTTAQNTKIKKPTKKPQPSQQTTNQQKTSSPESNKAASAETTPKKTDSMPAQTGEDVVNINTAKSKSAPPERTSIDQSNSSQTNKLTKRRAQKAEIAKGTEATQGKLKSIHQNSDMPISGGVFAQNPGSLVIPPPIPASLIDSERSKVDLEDSDDVSSAPIARKTHESRTQKAAPEARPLGTISVASMPAAELYIDGKRRGTTNDLGTSSEWIELSEGTHRIELKRAGFIARTETIDVEAAGHQKFGPYTLQRGNPEPIRATSYRLTLAANLLPVEVVITNMESKSAQLININQTSQTINLERGVYEVVMKRKSDTRRRRIDLTGAAQQLTFSVEFKD